MVFLIIIILIIGTIYAFSRSSTGSQQETAASGTAYNDDIRIYSGIGRLRIPLSNSSTMIISIAFPYSASDIAFSEELAVKIGEFRFMAIEYFTSLSPDEIVNFNEDAAKQEILKLYNSNLRLGRIQAVYFGELIIIDSIN